ncbi:hypothetical protein F5J12DRAFT_780815 [Pisolithus orientalis]|uniref:uncharacterized protein n=1 Tax=Pisolithus orientalis TaxID=936130 RepID=UPI002225A013|nr:uncharacterized protein F5J12DRAFT_780815 [Pisolithus orientalis]KAI6019709.1 hypothetical protein F5J12DRAFT_780815 [Pisolithus orientalis]
MSKDSNKNRYQTIDGTYKLISSLPPPKHGHMVHVMDKFTASELEGTIIHEPWIQVSSPQSLGYVTNIIFESFRDTFTSIAPSYSTSFNQGGLSEDSLVSLYNNDRKRWNWELHPPPGSDSPPKQPGPLASELPVESEKLCFENLSSKPQHQWMADWSRTSLQGSTVSLDEIMWLSPKVITEYSKESFKPASHLGKMMDTKAYLTLVDQPWRHYVLGLSITDSELQLHFYDHSGGAISPSINIHTDAEVFIYISGILPSGNSLLTPASPKHIPAIGRIQVNKTFYKVLNVLFLSTGFLGRGTVCYLACYNGEYYVIKDYWVEESEQRTALHEVNMMKLVHNIDRVPKLQHYWVIKVELGIQALERGVLHRDCSINNVMIEDFANGLRSFLLNWEFAVWVTLQGEYDLGGTEAITKSGKTNVPLIWKSASLTCVFIDHPTTIHHTFADDIKSLFYIFIWILILYDGPLGHEHQDISHERTLLGLWSEKVAEDLKIARCTKFTFLNDPSKSRLDSEVSQYFQDLIPLANECMPYKKPLEMTNAFQQIIAQHKALNSSMHPSQENDMDVMSLAIMSSKHLCEEMSTRAAHALSNPFPSKSHDLNLSITEALVTVVIEWNQHGVQFEDGYWPDHKQDMACLMSSPVFWLQLLTYCQ